MMRIRNQILFNQTIEILVLLKIIISLEYINII